MSSQPTALGRAPVVPARRSQLALWRDILGLLKEFWLAHPIASTTLVLLELVGNARTGIYVISTGRLVDALTSPAGMADGRPVLFWLLLFLLARAVEEFYWVLHPTLFAYLRDHGTYRIQEKVLRRAASAPLVRFDDSTFFDGLQRANAGMGERLVGLVDSILGNLQGFLMLASVSVSLYVVHPLLLPLLMAGILPGIWLHARVATALYEFQRSQTTSDRIRSYLQRLLTGRTAASELRLFGLHNYFLGYWRELRAARRRGLLAAETRRAVHNSAAGLFSTAAYGGGLLLVAFLILRGRLSVGDYVAVTTGALWFQGMLRGSIVAVRSLAEEAQFLGDLFEFLRMAGVDGAPATGVAADVASGALVGAPTGTPADVPAGVAVDGPEEWWRWTTGGQAAAVAASPGGSARGFSIAAERISFSYPGSEVPVIRDVTLHINAGERIAIVGENGAGKTTLVKLLIGLYQPQAGRVIVNGSELTPEYAAGVVQPRVAVVFQDYATYPLTARENIGFGDLSRLWDETALAAAAERAGIKEFIERLPQRYDTYLGRQFGDTDLSGGQWQKIALARAFLRDADLVVLDEPTAAMDPLAELALFERFIELVQGRTAIMISHRLGAARLADRIFVMRDGRVVEEGTHHALMARDGEYARLFRAQAQWYQ
ncbi:MAG: ABC transporter ATP-binding protein [Limnochordales bacterium]|nr:ABC transporter ATP-binding protein [Limnochordales bacterium]